MSALKYWIWLSTRTGIGAVRAKHLIDRFGTPEDVYHAGNRDYLDITGIKKDDINRLMNKDLTDANNILSSCAEIGCRTVTFQDSEYPDRLRNIYDPPLVLYVKGNLPYIDDEVVVGIVGTRKCTPYGLVNAENIANKLSSRGVIVTTGLALGVDTAAARGALKGGSAIIGIIGCGLNVIYPPENKSIYEDVASSGALISEYPPDTPPVKTHFPARNRIISGISLGIAVIEAPKQSGALITAARALEQGRDVFTLPGNVDAASCEGSNALLKEGAIPFVCADDIIDEYIELYPDRIGIQNKSISKKSFDNTAKVDYIDLVNLLGKLEGDEKSIVESIGLNSVTIDEVIDSTGFPVQKILAALTMLEISRYIIRANNGTWEISGSR
ncbi:MAG: DNA-processing protein DprA [Oscillospiraceae bacterium]|jgi:DNA processing protein|nr:DNA-processing protein DprA [Oscillospiraceae bacterium]